MVWFAKKPGITHFKVNRLFLIFVKIWYKIWTILITILCARIESNLVVSFFLFAFSRWNPMPMDVSISIQFNSIDYIEFFIIISINSSFQSLPNRNGYHFDTALLLSIFLGMFGIDRFYLGYPAIGLLKFCTFGFMFLGQLVDVILIATQMVTPADGSAYIISYYGPVLSVIRSDNTTYRRPQSDW